MIPADNRVPLGELLEARDGLLAVDRAVRRVGLLVRVRLRRLEQRAGSVRLRRQQLEVIVLGVAEGRVGRPEGRRPRRRAVVGPAAASEVSAEVAVAGDAVDGATGDLSAGSLALFDASLVVGDF